MKIWEEKKFCCKIFERKKMFGSRVTLLFGCHVVNELNVAGNVGCHVNERGLLGARNDLNEIFTESFILCCFTL